MRTCFTWVLAATVLASPSLVEAGNVPSTTTGRPQLTNVELSPNGSMSGLLINSAGQPVSGLTVNVHSQSNVNKVAQSVKTDKSGRFQLGKLRTGSCVVSVSDASYACRVWSNGTAPPNAISTPAFVTGKHVVRGQNRPTIMQRIYSLSTKQKVCLGLIIGAAIAIPIALDDDSSPNAS